MRQTFVPLMLESFLLKTIQESHVIYFQYTFIINIQGSFYHFSLSKSDTQFSHNSFDVTETFSPFKFLGACHSIFEMEVVQKYCSSVYKSK